MRRMVGYECVLVRSLSCTVGEYAKTLAALSAKALCTENAHVRSLKRAWTPSAPYQNQSALLRLSKNVCVCACTCVCLLPC